MNYFVLAHDLYLMVFQNGAAICHPAKSVHIRESLDRISALAPCCYGGWSDVRCCQMYVRSITVFPYICTSLLPPVYFSNILFQSLFIDSIEKLYLPSIYFIRHNISYLKTSVYIPQEHLLKTAAKASTVRPKHGRVLNGIWPFRE